MNLNQLLNQLDELSQRAAQIDNYRSENKKPLFDAQLFVCHSKRLTPYVDEAKSNVDALLRERQNKQLTHEQVAHLCERLIKQITALQKEFSATKVRSKEKLFTPKAPIPIHQLRADLAQHQEWERRLRNMVIAATEKLEQSQNHPDQQQMRQHLLATEQRLAKCTEARKKIENWIIYKEKKG